MSTKRKLRKMQLAQLKMQARSGGQTVPPSRLSGSLAGGLINMRRAARARDAARDEAIRDGLVNWQNMPHAAIAAQLGVANALVDAQCAQIAAWNKVTCPHPSP